MKRNLSFFIIIISVILAGCSTTKSILENEQFLSLKEKIEEKFNDTLFAHAHWGALIKSLETGETWYEQNSEKMFMPASNEKIPTTATTLTKLDNEFTFTTKLYYNGAINDSILNGDIVIIGNGDPTLYNRFYDDPRQVFREWANKLKNLNIKIIQGNIIGDDNLFDDERIGYGWPLDGLGQWYSAEIGPLQLNENYVDLTIIPPATETDSLLIVPNLPSKYFTIINDVVVSDTGRNIVWAQRNYGTNEIHVKGFVVIGTKQMERSPSIYNPTLFYVTVLKEVFEEEGIVVEGLPIDCDDLSVWQPDYDNFILIDKHSSPPLKEILKGLMKRSQNLYAETMPRLLGLQEYGLGSFSNGKKVVEETLDKFGIIPGTYRYMDGSGLSRYNFISPAQIVKILESMYNSDKRETWLELFPIGGVDGTLRSRMKGTSAEGNVRAKTGTISNVRALSGYVNTKDGETLVFSFLVNGHLRTSRDTELITDRVLELISDFSKK